MKKYLIAIIPLTSPLVVFAAAPTDFKEFIELVLKVLQNFIGIGFASIAVGMVYGVVLFLLNSDNDKKREEIKGYLMYGVIASVVTLGLWGFIEILNSTVFGGAVGIPQITPPS